MDAAHSGLFVDNAEIDGTGESITVFDPSFARTLATLAEATDADVDRAVRSTAAAFRAWFTTWSALERGRLCARVARLILERSAELTDVDVCDGGLPVSLARRDVEAAARYFEYYGGLAEHIHGRTVPVSPGVVDYTLREPWGVCAVILPFNFPLQITARSLAAALITGNGVVLKPAEQAPFGPLALARLCRDAGAPPGIVNAVTGRGPTTGQALITHPLVDHITFTGSGAAGARIMAAAAARVTPVTPELGGKSPHLVFSDADLERATSVISATTFRSAGQACSAGTRILAHRSVHAELSARLAAAAEALSVGPAIEDPDMGPVISEEQRVRILDAIHEAVRADARAIAGPTRGSGMGEGYFVAPTVLAAPSNQSVAARDEIFGPVITVMPFETEEEALEAANDTEYGLVAGIWTRDLSRALRLARDIRAGQIFVNNYGVGGGVDLPFGGFKRSGFGRLKGLEGAYEYTQVKNVCVAIGG